MSRRSTPRLSVVAVRNGAIFVSFMLVVAAGLPVDPAGAAITDYYEVDTFTTGSAPRGMAVDPQSGDIFVASRTDDSVERRSATGDLVDTITGVSEPQGVFITSYGDVYVAEEGADRVSVWSTDGDFKRAWGVAGSGNGQFDEPCDAHVTAAGEVFVADTGNNRIQVFDVNGGYLRQWGTAGSANGQFNMTCSHSGLVVLGDEVYVADTVNNRVQVFDLAGTYLRQWGSFGSGEGQFSSPYGIDAVDGLVFVTDGGNTRVQVFSGGGQFQSSIETPGVPVGIVVDPSRTAFWVSADSSASVVSFTNTLCFDMPLTLVASSYDDDLTGTSGGDVVFLSGGNDTFEALGGADRVCGGSGNDVIRGRGGNDRIDGGNGDDVIIGGNGKDIITGRGGDDVVRGGNDNDTIEGLGGNDTLKGQAGDDVLRGGGGNDRLVGGDDNDTLKGQGGNDFLSGNPGNDVLLGGAGTDTCNGGGGHGDWAANCETTTGVP